LSQAFFGSEYVENLDQTQTLSCVFQDDYFDPSRSLSATPTAWAGLSVVCSNQTLAVHNHPSPEASGLLQFAIAQFLEAQRDYDVTLIDCPPNLYQCSWNALLAADCVVVPVPPEDFGAQGLRAVHQAITNARQLNPRLHLLGHLVTRYDRRLLVHRSYEARLRQQYGTAVLQTVVPEASAFKVALACRKPVLLHDPASKAAKSMMDLAHEVLKLMGENNMQGNRVQHGQYP
jgi:chromosome partitioning protein